ncbi:MAG: NAD(+) synthase [Ruminococcaceae bacterium]|nr:NAD(+) synthase [Oscillospiraceae bacterium]
MKHGFIKTATVSPELRVADTVYNAEKIIEAIHAANDENVSLLVFPELCVTGYTCADLFLHRPLLDAAKKAVDAIVKATEGIEMLIFIGAPIRHNNKVYDTAIAIYDGSIRGIVPKKNLANYGESYEARQFSVFEGDKYSMFFDVDEESSVPFTTNIVFAAPNAPEFTVACEIGEDLMVPESPSVSHAKAGANIIVNLAASAEIVGRAAKRRLAVTSASAKLVCAYLYANAGCEESTTDGVFSGHSMIAYNGKLLSEKKPFETGMQTAIIDVQTLADERMKKNTYPAQDTEDYFHAYFDMPLKETETPKYPKRPFIPTDKNEFEERAESIINIQAYALKKRIAHSRAKTAVIGISGGLDSTLALLIAARAMDLLGRDRKDIISVTMPCFGTTQRTKSNAVLLAEALGTTVRTVDIKRAVSVHFEDIGHDENNHDVTFENAQARERTQVIMDIANQTGGLVVGTGDLSEVALGWSTYNGDHMSMYGVNADVPKTLVRYLVAHFANGMEGEAKACLLDILDTPVSPELLPAKDGEITQKTEDIVGPYDLHDFFLYYTIRKGYTPSKLFRVATCAFADEFDGETILKWMTKFYSRFFTQQFKRSCVPDGPKVGSVALSPRGDWKMPSDAMATAWMNELDEIQI